LTAELPLGTDLAGHPGHLVREGGQLVDHRVDGALQLQDLALCDHRDLLRQVAVGHGGRHLGDVAHLRSEERRVREQGHGQGPPAVGSGRSPAAPRSGLWPPSLPSVPTSRATRVTSSANEDSWSTIVLTVSFSSRISPCATTVIFWDRSPLATAVATWAMLRT